MTATNTPQPSQLMSQSDERIMRLIFLTRRTCDNLSRDLVSHVLRQQNKGSFQDWLSKIDPEDWHRDLKIHFGSRLPRLDECDTTVLTSIVQKLDTKQFFKTLIDEIRKMRNSVCHVSLEINFSDALYEDNIKNLSDFLLNIDGTIFPCSADCINFLKENINQTLEHFCATHPNDVVCVLRKLELEFPKLAQQIQCLREKIEELESKVSKYENHLNQHDNQLSQQVIKLNDLDCKLVQNFEQFDDKLNQTVNKVYQLEENLDCSTAETAQQKKSLENHDRKIKQHETKITEIDKKLDESLKPDMSLHEPVNNIPNSTISGRENDLKMLNELFSRLQIVVITGCPGIGKTALAQHYANSLPAGVSPTKVSFQGFSAEPEDAKAKIAMKIGSSFSNLQKAIEKSQDPLALLQNCINESLVSIFLILDNIDDIIASNLSQQLEEVMDEITSIGGRVKILGTSRDKTLSPSFVESGRLELQPISEESRLSWLNDQESSLSQEMKLSIANYSHGIPLILSILYKYVDRHKNIEIEELRTIKESKDWEKLNTTLTISFKRLSDSQLLAMQVASVLAHRDRFSIEIFVRFFEAVCENGANASSALRDCQDMHLIEVEGELYSIFYTKLVELLWLGDSVFGGQFCNYFLHPYIEQYVKSQYCNDIDNIKSRLMCHIFLTFTDLWKKGQIEIKLDNESNKKTWFLLLILLSKSKTCSTGFASLFCQAAINSLIPLIALTVIIHTLRVAIDGGVAVRILLSMICPSLGELFNFVQKLFEIFTRQKKWLHAIAVACSLPIKDIIDENESTRNDVKKILVEANKALQIVSSSGSDYQSSINDLQMYKSILNMQQAVYNRNSDQKKERASAHVFVTDSLKDFGIFCRKIDKSHSILERRNCIEALCYLFFLYYDGFHSVGNMGRRMIGFRIYWHEYTANAKSHHLACFKKYTQICLDLAWDMEMEEKKTLVENAKALGCSI